MLRACVPIILHMIVISKWFLTAVTTDVVVTIYGAKKINKYSYSYPYSYSKIWDGIDPDPGISKISTDFVK
jgi:hypothetical protein